MSYKGSNNRRVVTGGKGDRGGGGGDRGSYRGGKWRGGRGGGPKYNNRNRKNGPGPRPHLDEDDDMGEVPQPSHNRSRFTPYQQNSQHRSRGNQNYQHRRNVSIDTSAAQRMGLPMNRHNNRSHGSGGRMETSPSGWYKVTIPHGKKTEKDVLLQNITGLATAPFTPIQFHYLENTAMFYVNDKDAAEALRGCSRRLTAPNGFKIVILVRASEPPKTMLNDSTIAQLQSCLSHRYDAVTCTLRLNALMKDEGLKRSGVYLTVTNYKVAAQILTIIKQNTPDLQGLDLSDNRLTNLDNFQTLRECAPKLTRLSLGKNILRTESALQSLKNLNLQELYLDGNPLCDNYKDEKSYISAIRKKFPKVVKLDGHELPPPITFDVDDQVVLPARQQNCYRNEQLQTLVGGFLQTYFSVYDGQNSSNREQLLEAYHDHAVFSLAIGYNQANPAKQIGFNDYYQESRNLKKMSDSAAKDRTMRVGRLRVVTLLSQLPATEHDPQSMTVDISLESPTLLSFTVTGIFKERKGLKTGQPLLRAFSRMFVAAPSPNGSIVIVNEQYNITNPSQEQSRSAFSAPRPAPTTSSPAVATASPATSTNDILQKQQMVIRFAEESSMNLSWAEECLVQNGWDYEKAGRCYLELKEKGNIPPEAFVKS